MNLTTHEVTPEEIMAWLDGELSNAEAHAVAAHVDDCVECADLATRLRDTTQALSSWVAPPVSTRLESSAAELAKRKFSGQRLPKQKLFLRPSFWTWKQWTLGAGCAIFVLLLTITLSFPTVGSLSYRSTEKRRTLAFINHPQAIQSTTDQGSLPVNGRAEGLEPLTSTSSGVVGFYDNASPAPPPPPPAASTDHRGRFTSSEAVATPRAVGQLNTDGGRSREVPGPSRPAPMIARTVSLTITVKDFAVARASLDAVLARHQGYSAQLTVNTPENSPRSFQASLRIPAPELSATLGELRALGRVQNESQSGDEVTQQHTDLLARLKNSREIEQRLQAILQQRTGKVEEVLQVEEEIERVRGEIEGMEADQKALEHRIDFATIDLQLAEEYKAQFNSPDTSASTRMHNAFVAGIDNASNTLLGGVLFFEEYGPVLLIWLVIIGVPAFLVWRRYRKVRPKV